MKNTRAYYTAFGEALEGLYREELVTLAEGKKPGDEFNPEVFDRAAEWIRQRGSFTTDMLAEQPALDVINETFRVLGGAVSSSIAEKVPPELVGALENNAFVFSGFKTFHSLNEVGLSLVDDKGGIKPFEAFQKDVEKINARYNGNYLYAEYNHAVTSSQMAAKWHDFEKDGDRYNLQYRTAGDELVRAEHQALHNTTLPPDDPFWTQFTPPNGWNCRCTVVQVRKNRYPESDSAKATEIGEAITADSKMQMFRFNPGKELKLYPDKHPYYKAPKDVKKVVEKLDRERQKELAGQPADLEEIRIRRREIREAVKDLPEQRFSNARFPKPITISNKGIKEWLNQPHKHLAAKNEILAGIADVIKNSTYLGSGVDIHNASMAVHLFETMVGGEKSWVVVRELPSGECRIHSISDNESILKYIQKKPSEK